MEGRQVGPGQHAHTHTQEGEKRKRQGKEGESVWDTYARARGMRQSKRERGVGDRGRQGEKHKRQGKEGESVWDTYARARGRRQRKRERGVGTEGDRERGGRECVGHTHKQRQRRGRGSKGRSLPRKGEVVTPLRAWLRFCCASCVPGAYVYLQTAEVVWCMGGGTARYCAKNGVLDRARASG